MDKVTVYAPLGMLGYGFPSHSLSYAVKQAPDVIAVDAGSTDPGPYYLGSGESFTSKTMVKRDLTMILAAAYKLKVPLIIGSVGGGGAAPHVEMFVGLLREVTRDLQISPRVAIISADQDKDTLVKANREGRISNFETDQNLTDAEIAESSNIVAQMGVEPIIEALSVGVDVVVAGRAYDAALMAAYPIMKGFDPGLAYHMGKILECGSLIALPRESDGALAYLSGDHFVVEPADPNKTTGDTLVAAHTLYEKSNPMHLKLPGGRLDLTETTFTNLSDRCVKVTGSSFIKEDYRIKLEGSALRGYRSICVSGIRDPFMIAHLAEVKDKVRTKLDRDLKPILQDANWELIFHTYGLNAVMGGREPVSSPAHEVALVVEAVAGDQDTANTIIALARSAVLHMGYESRKATAGNVAFLYTPAEFPAPPAYEFSIYHLLDVEDLSRHFQISYETITGGSSGR